MTSTGALLQLVAKGDDYTDLFHNDLKGEDKNNISLFKSSYKKITNFSETPFSLSSENAPRWGGKAFFKVKKYGDLLGNMYLAFELPSISVTDIVGLSESERNTEYRIRWNEYVGNVAIEYVILRIGGQQIDKISGEYMQFYSDMYDTTWSKLCMLGHEKHMIFPNRKIESQYVYVPLKFFFNKDPSNYLPLCALQYHDIEIEVKIRDWNDMYYVLKELTNDVDASESKKSKLYFAHTNNTIAEKQFSNFRLDCNYIFLDTEERKLISQSKYEILMTQVQELKTTVSHLSRVKLNFQNSIKELFFVLNNQSNIDLSEVYNYSGKQKYLPVGTTNITEILWEQIPERHLLKNASLIFDGNDRVPKRDYKYWQYIQNYENYRNTLQHNICMYNFGMTRNEHTGSCNFSEMENDILELELSEQTTEFIHYTNADTVTIGPNNTCLLNVYATSYNVFIIENGLSEVKFPF